MMVKVKLSHIARVKAKLANGERVEYHYAGRGGPRFWKTGGPRIGSPEYVKAYQDALDSATAPEQNRFRSVIKSYRESPEFKSKAPRTRRDYDMWLARIDDKFGEALTAKFEEARIRRIALSWRNQWTGKQAQYAWTVLRLLVSWACDNGHLDSHHIRGGGNPYRQKSRAEVIWADSDIDAFMSQAPGYVQRILTTAIETGLRPGDLIHLSRFHFKGNIIEITTRKRDRKAFIPVTPEMRSVLENTDPKQSYILTNSHGDQFSEIALSRAVRRYADKAGIDPNLRLYDCRGTAVTRWVLAKWPLDDVARATGWKVATASSMIDVYARVNADPVRAKEVLNLLEIAKRLQNGQ